MNDETVKDSLKKYVCLYVNTDRDEELVKKSEKELKDSDNDGYDDYTEFKNGTSPKDPKIFPALRDGKNKVTIR